MVGKTEEINGKLDELNKLIHPYQLAYVSPVNDCIPLERNAHFMEKDKLDKLVSNVAEDGFLSQLPFAMKRQDGKYLILSGNHRLKASIKAKLDFILILYIDEVSKDKQIAYQLSHNELVGKDDLRMLKDIYKEIESIEMKKYSGLDDLKFQEIKEINPISINDADIELTEVKFLFVESRKNRIEETLSVLERQKLTENSSIVVGSFEAFVKTITEIKKKYGIKSVSVAFGRMIDIVNEVIKE